MGIQLSQHQLDAIEKLQSGKILIGAVGTGKTRTALVYFYTKVCQGKIKINGLGEFSEMKFPRNLLVITTAMNRDKLTWQKEMLPFILSTDKNLCINKIDVVVDSWQSIKKYIDLKDWFIIYDEQRLIGTGVWVKSFLKMSKNNLWIMLSATPSDQWSDLIPIFIANGFYKNRTDFINQHVIYKRFIRYPVVDYYIGLSKLRKLRDQIMIEMPYQKHTIPNDIIINVLYDKELYRQVMKYKWNPYKNKPIESVSELCYTLRRIINSDSSRLEEIENIYNQHKRLIIFYNYVFEVELLLELAYKLKVVVAQWNGQKHEQIPEIDCWWFLVQYQAGNEAWNNIDTDTMIFYSQNYSYRIMVQASGRIDRLNTPFVNLYYYHLRSNAPIDLAIQRALINKKNFNEKQFTNF